MTATVIAAVIAGLLLAWSAWANVTNRPGSTRAHLATARTRWRELTLLRQRARRTSAVVAALRAETERMRAENDLLEVAVDVARRDGLPLSEISVVEISERAGAPLEAIFVAIDRVNNWAPGGAPRPHEEEA